MIGRAGAFVLGSIVAGCASTAGVLAFLGWGRAAGGQAVYVDPSRGDYVDILLMLVTVLLAAVGLAVTVGAIVIGIVAFKTLRESKDEAAESAKTAATKKINEKIASDLGPNVKSKVDEALPDALRHSLVEDELGHKILNEMAKRGELDEVLERVLARLQGPGPESQEEA